MRWSHRLVLVVWLVVVWVALWGSVTPANVLTGLAVAIVLTYVFPPRGGSQQRVRPLALARLAAHFTWKLAQANVEVAWEVITPKSNVNEGIIAVPIDDAPDGVVALVANAVSLTPGTLTLEVHEDPTVLYVHVLHLRSVDDARAEVQTFYRLARAAFPADDETSATDAGGVS